ncbi:MAG: GntR family transcriptional regulator [Mesorhizobium sp.]|nr:GntR family transcriptional regulator [Mesorhizobium sp.]MCO5161383.1 GntR family transcriptional regulator [Mesorhizobium sp.]
MYSFLQPLERTGRGSTTERVYSALRDAIVHRQLRPGEFVDKNLVCERLGVSRFPVSEALGRLAAQGFVEVLPQRGTRVSRISLKDVRQNLLIRRALEAETVRELARRTPPRMDRLEENIAAQRAALAAGDDTAYYNLDVEFHAILQQELGYPYVTATIDAARAGLDRVRRMLGSLHRTELTFREHAAIVEAIRAGNSEGAADAMRSHLDNVDVLLASFASENPDLFSR